MKRLWCAALWFVLGTVPLAALPDYLEKSDDLSFHGDNMGSYNLLQGQLPQAASDSERAEIYWRLSRDTLHDADDHQAKIVSKDQLLAIYRRGESFADQAIAADPNNPHGYFWKASNLGRWGQARGVFSSLNLVDPIRKLAGKAADLSPTYGDPWFLLGQLYEQVPAVISYGNPIWAVSLGRKAVDTRTQEVANGTERSVPFDYYVQLARHLAKRDWSAGRRTSEQAQEAAHYQATSDPVDQADYYEGSVTIPSMSDRDEAKQIDRFVISEAASDPASVQGQEDVLDHAKSDLASWGG